MLSSSNSLLPAGVNKWMHPKPLLDAINGCVRTAASCLCGYSYLSEQKYFPYGRAKEGHISIKLSDIKIAYINYASDLCIANKSILAGATEEGVWRIAGLPNGLVLLGKSPDDSNCLLEGVDFFNHNGFYFFSKNPMVAGTLTTKSGEEVVDYYYLGGSVSIIDFPQFNLTKYGVQTPSSDTLVHVVKSGGPTAYGGVGLLSTAAAGRFAAMSEGKLDKLWEEGDLKIGLVNNQLIYADKYEETKAIGDQIKFGDSLMTASETTGTVSLDCGDISWVPGSCDITNGPVSHSEVVIDYAHKDLNTHKFVADYRPDTASNTIIQPIKISGVNATELTDTDVAKIKKVWVLYGGGLDPYGNLKPHSGMSVGELLYHAVNAGGCIECSNLKSSVSETGDGFIRALSLGGVPHGSPLSYGSSIYGLALEIGDGKLYKVINVFPTVTAVAQSTLLLDIYLNKPFEIDKEKPLADDSLSWHWLEVEQELEIFDLLDTL